LLTDRKKNNLIGLQYAAVGWCHLSANMVCSGPAARTWTFQYLHASSRSQIARRKRRCLHTLTTTHQHRWRSAAGNGHVNLLQKAGWPAAARGRRASTTAGEALSWSTAPRRPTRRHRAAWAAADGVDRSGASMRTDLPPLHATHVARSSSTQPPSPPARPPATTKHNHQHRLLSYHRQYVWTR